MSFSFLDSSGACVLFDPKLKKVIMSLLKQNYSKLGKTRQISLYQVMFTSLTRRVSLCATTARNTFNESKNGH